MSDFIADLEAELQAAARRRAAARPRPRIAWRAVAAAAACAAVVAVVAGAVWLAAPGPDDDVAVSGDTVHTATTTLRSAVPPVGCAGEPERHMSASPPALLELLGVLRRPQTEPDALPAAGGGWVPLGAYAPKGVRWPGRDRLAAELHLVPGVGPMPDGRAGCDAKKATRPPAVCLVVGPAGAPRVACFADGEIANGAAAALVDGTVYGVVPDGFEEVTLEAGGRTVSTEVVDNAYEARLPGARAGDEVTVRLARGSGCKPAVDPELLRTVPVLRRPPDPGVQVPRAVLVALTGGLEDAARIAGGGDEITYWVLPFGSGDPDRAACGMADRACVMAVHDGGDVQGRLVERVPELLPAGGTVVANTTTQQLERSEVLYLAGREAEAHPIGAALGITQVREASREELAEAGAPGAAVIAVLVGLDLRMR